MDVVAVTRLGAHELGRVERPARKHQRPGVHSPENLQVCPQHWFDPILAARVRSFSKVRLLYGHKLNAYEVVNGGIRADITDAATGAHLSLDARYLVGCDGAGSSVRHAAGIRIEPPPSLAWAMGTTPAATKAPDPDDDAPAEAEVVAAALNEGAEGEPA